MTGQPAADSAMRSTYRHVAAIACVLCALLCACTRQGAAPARDDAAREPSPQQAERRGSVTISGDDAQADALNWSVPAVVLDPDKPADARKRADLALRAGALYEDGNAAIPLYLAILAQAPGDAAATKGLLRAIEALLAQGDASLRLAGEDADALRQAHLLAAVARTVRADAPAVQAYLERVDLADRLWALNIEAERDIEAGRYGAQGGGALGKLREILQLQPGQARAMQGVAAVESGLIRSAEAAGEAGDFNGAVRWLALAAKVRPGSATLDDARARIEILRVERVARLRDAGLRLLPSYNGVGKARDLLAEVLRIARPGDPAAAELRTRIDLATHYGQFRPGQSFTEALKEGGQGPRMIVVPHGAFRMGAEAGETGAQDYEQPARYLRFDQGFAMAVHEVTVGEFGRYLAATKSRTRASRRGYSMPYDERSGNFVRRSGVGPDSDYLGAAAADALPVLHVSARDADAYAKWLSAQTGHGYRLPSEAEYEYALRAGGTGLYPWGSRGPPRRSGNLTGGRDSSPAGRSWKNAFPGYADGYWGPAPVGSFRANGYGLHDLAGNVSEWVADCWHDGYRRAPKDPQAWFNPGCRVRVIRGGSWASAPAQLRSVWRAPVDIDTTNAQIGFRVVRDL